MHKFLDGRWHEAANAFARFEEIAFLERPTLEQIENNASTLGRTASIKSQASESRPR